DFFVCVLGDYHEHNCQHIGRAGGSAARLFSGAGDVSLDQAAGPENVSKLARKSGRFRGTRRQSGTVQRLSSRGPRLGTGSGRPKLCVPDQDVLFALRDRRRYLRRRYRQPTDPAGPGGTRRDRVNPALAGLKSLIFCARPCLALQHAFLQYLTSDGVRQGLDRPPDKTVGKITHHEETSDMRNGIFHLVSGTAVAIALTASPAFAQKKYDTGATDTEIKIGQTVPFSGPASAYATIGKAQAAYIKMINDQGGVNGRKINLVQYDDAYSPPKAVEQVRKLVESDQVLLTFQILGTPSNAAVQ